MSQMSSSFYYGNYQAWLESFVPFYFFDELNVTTATAMFPDLIHYAWMLQIRTEIDLHMKFSIGMAKCIGYPLGLLLQILTIVFLVRGGSGYSRSAKNWFLLVLSADIASILYRAYDLLSQDLIVLNPYEKVLTVFGQKITLFMWGLRRKEDEFAQQVMCKVFFIILYFPIHLSPIALTVSAIIRAYCVKFPLRAKAVLTTRVDRCLMASAVLLSLAIAVVIGGTVIDGWSDVGEVPLDAFGYKVHYGQCAVPRADYYNADKKLLFIGFVFMLSVIFVICLFNLISAVVIIIVLFEAKQNRKKMTASEGADSNAEVRATAMLLGMSVTLFLCFFISRVLVVMSTQIRYGITPVTFAVVERLGSYLFNIPYYTNWLFIAGFTKKFYEFFLPCLFRAKHSKTVSSVTMKTIEESRMEL